jgi:GTP cyclohydrolase I
MSELKPIMETLIKTQLEFLGEDPEREGLIGTPARVLKSWGELYSGYGKDPKDILTVFEKGTYNQIVLLQDIELYSMCEHHILPFHGKAHVAYLPGEKVIGISKLARLVDIYARRLQIQERIGEQVTTALMEILNAKGAACYIEASHMCMKMRGCNKQNSIMKTSSLKGVFLTDPSLKNEMLMMIISEPES